VVSQKPEQCPCESTRRERESEKVPTARARHGIARADVVITGICALGAFASTLPEGRNWPVTVLLVGLFSPIAVDAATATYERHLSASVRRCPRKAGGFRGSRH
jgi:hypothetical protein